MPPYVGPRSLGVVWTAGSVMSMPIPAGTSMGDPLTKTSRCAWTWKFEELVGLGLEAGGDGEIERVRWSRPWDSTRRRFGGGLRFLNLG